MKELIWLNGKTMPLSEARIGVEDRGFQFADGVYEVLRIYNGRLFAYDMHWHRLVGSAKNIRLDVPIEQSTLLREMEQLIEQSNCREGMIYLQLTRGESARAHAFPDSKPTLLFYARELPPAAPAGTGNIRLHSVPDERWSRCWIKSIALLPNILAKNTALAAGADEAVFIHEGNATECSASNLFAVIGGELITPPIGPKVLPGITRAILLNLAGHLNIPVEERPIAETEIADAQELFITSTTREVNWVSTYNGRHLHKACGPVTMKLHEALLEKIRRNCAL